MAKAVANCVCSICGKPFVVTTYRRNRASADDFESWAENAITTCRDCERAAQDQAIREKAVELDPPALTGSEKQIKWAMSIRDELLRDVDRLAARFGDDFYGANRLKRKVKLVTDAKTASRWWIDLKVQHGCADATTVVGAIKKSNKTDDKNLYAAIIAI